MIDTFIPISLASITHNEEKNLGHALKSPRDWFRRLSPLIPVLRIEQRNLLRIIARKCIKTHGRDMSPKKTLWMRIFKTMVLKHAWRDGWRG